MNICSYSILQNQSNVFPNFGFFTHAQTKISNFEDTLEHLLSLLDSLIEFQW